MLNELQVIFRPVSCDAAQFRQDLLHAGRADVVEDLVLLKNLATHVEGQVFAVDDAAQKAQIRRHQALRVVGYKNAFDIKFYAGPVVGLVHIGRGLRGYVEERGVLHGPFGVGVEPEQRLFPIARNCLVELLVVLRFQLAFGTLPHRAGGVDLLCCALRYRPLLLLVPFVLIRSQKNGKCDVIRILPDDFPKLITIAVFLAAFVEEQGHGSTGNRAFRRFNLKAGLPVAGPLPGGVFAGFARNHLHLIGHHKSAVEADSELTDEVGIAPGITGEVVEEVFRAGSRDGTEVRNQVVLIHADTGVADGECGLFFVEVEVDAGFERK